MEASSDFESSADPRPDGRGLRAGQGFARLVEIMARLRSPQGCPWDREQNFDTIKPYLLEETYEVLDAIDARDFEGLAEELGDLLLQSVFFAQMASEEGRFDIADSLEAINSKLIRRHPHVFGSGDAKTADDVKRRWDEIKAEEKPRRDGLLSGVPRSLPALVEAQQIASRAAAAGFDWENLAQVVEKLREELAELESAQAAGRGVKGTRDSADLAAPAESVVRDSLEDARELASHADVEDEIGDLLFVIVNIARFLKVHPEQALRKTNLKFRHRFGFIEKGLAAAGKTPREATMEEMESLWQEAKRSLK